MSDPLRSAQLESGSALRELTDAELFLDRDLNWLEFNRRVLSLAADGKVIAQGKAKYG